MVSHLKCMYVMLKYLGDTVDFIPTMVFVWHSSFNEIKKFKVIKISATSF